MIWKLLRKNISIAQIGGYAIANLVGLCIIACAIQFYRDASSALGSPQTSAPADYLVISKQVSMLNTLGIGQNNTAFSAEEIASLEQQPWVKAVGEFTNANFGVSAAVEMDGRGMSSYLFLESIPDQFLDIIPDGWDYDPNDPNAVVPILISKDYLALYNFGFAASRGLPQLSEGLITRVPITLYLSGNGHRQTFRAHIAGFSNRYNTIAVPYGFMEWANGRFSSQHDAEPSRLVVQLSDPGNPEIAKYMSANGYEAAGEGLDQGKVHYFLTLLTSVVSIIGAIICALALFILMLSITLLMQRNREKNRTLLLLGYSPLQVEGYYFRLVSWVNASILALAIICLFIVKGQWQSVLGDAGLPSASPLAAILWAVGIMAVVTLINFSTIRNQVQRLLRN